MPQYSQNLVAKNPAGFDTSMNLDALGALLVTHGGSSLTSNITAATVVKATAGRVAKVFVNTAGSAAGTVSNCATTGAVAAANLVAAIPATAGVIVIDAACSAGIVVTPGTGQVLSVTYS